MRFKGFLTALPALAMMSAMPVAAQEVVFVAGTGEPVQAAPDISQELPEPDFYSNTGSESSEDITDLADRMSDPRTQAGVATAVERVSEAMMQLPVGRFAEAIERARPGTVNRRMRGDTTVADLAGRDAEYLPQELGDRSREMMGMMSGFARAMAVMMPEFERMGRDIEESLRTAKKEARRNRY